VALVPPGLGGFSMSSLSQADGVGSGQSGCDRPDHRRQGKGAELLVTQGDDFAHPERLGRFGCPILESARDAQRPVPFTGPVPRRTSDGGVQKVAIEHDRRYPPTVLHVVSYVVAVGEQVGTVHDHSAHQISSEVSQMPRDGHHVLSHPLA